MKLVGLVLNKWAPYVPDRALRVLIRMAFTALDEANEKNEAATYNADRGHLTSVMRSERHGTLESTCAGSGSTRMRRPSDTIRVTAST